MGVKSISIYSNVIYNKLLVQKLSMHERKIIFVTLAEGSHFEQNSNVGSKVLATTCCDGAFYGQLTMVTYCEHITPTIYACMQM